ncbi:MAG: lactate utilization protein B [Chitinophagales bacterium]|nr:lactate utilization protein [Chitinophagales bacterium]MDW8393297.1 lactate utilization protein B [Chitinophagales bacterium]
MARTVQAFHEAARRAGFDHELHRKLNYNIQQYDKKVREGKKQFADLTLASQRAKNLKWKALEQLDKLLLEFESNIVRRGARVVWAETAKDALQEIAAVVKRVRARSVVKSKSMTTEELHLNEFLERMQVEVVETDLGEYIQQLDGEPPFHIVTPAMHKSKEDVARVFHDKLGTPQHLTPQELTYEARMRLREKYLKADIGITGANFILPDIGGVLVLENEGNARLCVTFAKVHIVIAGIEKVIPSVHDLALFLPLLSTFGTGQKVTVYNTLYTGPRQEYETDGPEELIVILLDNGRTNLLAQARQREALYCIRCGACLNACPVYKNIGGHAYQTTYSGPIGKVITPHLRGMESYSHLSQASSLCGNCTEVCPMKINLHHLLVVNRQQAVEKGFDSFTERLSWKIWKRVMLSRRLMNMGSGSLKNAGIRLLFGKSWGSYRSMIQFPSKSFNELWREKQGE